MGQYLANDIRTCVLRYGNDALCCATIRYGQIWSCIPSLPTTSRSHDCRGYPNKQNEPFPWDRAPTAEDTTTTRTRLSEALTESFRLIFTFQVAHQPPRLCCMEFYCCKRRFDDTG